MRKFLIGLGLGLLGAILWVVASVVAGVASAGECLEESGFGDCDSDLFADPVSGSLVVVGFVVMLGGPALFWLILPIVGWVRRLRRKKKITPTMG
jgi:drug/metabolite transporter (DMT)-like permease